MSFPPRPPMGMPSMMGQGYGFPPVGMMGPMGMMPTQMMRPVSVGVTSSTATSTAAAAAKSKRLVPQEIPKDSKEDKPPVTTAFVGNISERAPDAMVRQMLQRCGNVLSWKRVQGASGKLQAFGFCEYEDPEATLRCMRLLNSWKITDKNLVVKVDAKTKTLLDEYKKKKRARENTTPEKRNGDKGENEEEETNGDTGKDDLDEFTKREDRVAKAGLDAIMREYAVELDKEPSHEPSAEEKKEKRKEQRKEKKEEVKDAGLDDMELEEGKKDLINREIQSFRDAHKGEEEKEAERNRERERRRREEERERERRERERERERREKEREMKKDRERTRSLSRERTRSRSRDRERERHERERERELEDEEEAYERRKLEKKLREKEAGYQERLKNWEARERKKTREYEKEREKEDERKAEESREARRLKEFLEDYDDERDDPKYYKGSALQRRLKEREKEMEADARDRQREKEEIDEIRRRLLEEGHPNLEEQMAKIERERDEHLMPRLHNTVISIQTPPSSPPPAKQPQQQQQQQQPPPQPQQSPQSQQLHQQHGIASQPQCVPSEPTGTNSKLMMPLEPSIADLPPEPQPMLENDMSPQSSPESDGCEPLPSASGYSDDSASQPFIGPATREDQQKAKIGFSAIKLGRRSASPGETAKNKRKKLTVGDVFNQDDDDTSDGPKKRKLEKLDYSQEEAEAVAPTSDMPTRPTTAEEKRKCIKMLIEKIPTAKEELFAYTLDWNMVDTTLMDRRIKPWVNKKIVEYIGEEEPTLTDFICQKVMAHSAPQIILNDVAMVLDEEAEVFVVKMWRLLIYETEAKKAGLVK